jgi:hypothetical protein
MFFHSLVAEDRFSVSILYFKCSNHFLDEFLIRHHEREQQDAPRLRMKGFSVLCALNKTREDLLPEHIVNFDESKWHLVIVGDAVVREIGSEVVHNYARGDAKANFTFFTSTCTDGSCLSLILIVRGTTQRCHQQFGNHRGYADELWQTPRGWSSEDLM